MKKTPHYWAVELAHKRIGYGTLISEGDQFVFKMLKQAIFEAARDVIREAIEHEQGAQAAHATEAPTESCGAPQRQEREADASAQDGANRQGTCEDVAEPSLRQSSTV